MAGMRYQPQGLARIRRDLVGRAVGALFTNGRTDIGGSGAEVAIFGAPDQVATPHGLARKFSAAKSAYATVTPPAGLIDTSAPYATVLAFVLDTVTVGQRLFMYRDTVNGQTIQLLVGGASRLAFMQKPSDSTAQGLGDDVLVAGRPYIACAGWDGNAFFLHINGVKQDGPNPGTISNSGAIADIVIAKRGSTSTYANAQISLFAHIKGQVDAAALSLNPWQLFDDLSDDDVATSAAAQPNTYTLSAAPGAFGLAGASAGLTINRRLAGGNGSFSLTGSAAGLRAGRRIVGSVGTITLGGVPAALVASRKLPAAAGAFALAGAEASLRVARRLAASAGSFTLAASDAQLVYSPVPEAATIVAGTGQLVLSGAAVGMRVTRRMQVQVGSFALAGAAAAINYTAPSGEAIDISKVSPARIVVFEGSGSRVVQFESSGSRVTPFGGSGSRVTPFEGSGSRTVRFE